MIAGARAHIVLQYSYKVRNCTANSRVHTHSHTDVQTTFISCTLLHTHLIECFVLERNDKTRWWSRGRVPRSLKLSFKRPRQRFLYQHRWCAASRKQKQVFYSRGTAQQLRTRMNSRRTNHWRRERLPFRVAYTSYVRTYSVVWLRVLLINNTYYTPKVT